MSTTQQQSFNVRFDTDTRERLDAIAAQSDRTLSQLVRYATHWWLASEDRVCPLHTVSDADGGRYVNVRYTDEVMAQIAVATVAMGISKAGVIRCAVRAWLTIATPDALGHPALAIASTPVDGPVDAVGVEKVPIAV